jgi:sterol desaturase/sphingolipid hydroxylase (fatty acid hydroxylase superfamily)
MEHWILTHGRWLAGGMAGVFALLLVLSWAVPLRAERRRRLHRYVTNAIMSALALGAGWLAVRPFSLLLGDWTAARGIGLLQWVALPPILHLAFGFLLLDISFYYWHRANHIVPLLWRFHNVHHVDPDLDVTTSFRFHPAEVIYSAPFRAAQVVLFGVPLPVFVLYELVFQCCTMFHHSNLRLPIRLERLLNLVLVTQRMHGIHHSNIEGETNANYSVILRWWDALHRTLALGVPQSQITIGMPGYVCPDDNTVQSLLLMPFRRQRDYWRLEDGTVPPRVRDAKASPQKRLTE